LKKNFLLGLIIITQVLGDIWLSRGMKGFGVISLKNIDIITIKNFLFYLLTNGWIALAVSFLLGSLVLYLIALKYFDLSYVLPMNAFSYVLNAVFALIILGEQIPLMRWFGIFTISLGVLLVGITDAKTTMQKNKQDSIIPAFLLPLGLIVSKTWLAVFILSFADATGDILLSKGMKEIPEISIKSPRYAWLLITEVMSNRNILGGVLSLSLGFFTLISALSWADISLIRPASALTYIISMLGARFILREKIAASRLLGISMIGFGVLFLAS